MRERLARSLFWLVWSRGVVQALSFVSTIVVARLLSPSDYGLMALVSIWTGTLDLLSELGLGAAIIQFRNLDDRDLNACFWLTMGTALLGTIFLYIAAPVLALWFATPPLTIVLQVACFLLPLTAVRVIPDSLLRKRLELDRISQAQILGSLATIPTVLSAAWAGAGVWALIAGAFVAAFIQAVFLFWHVRWRPGLRMGGGRLGEVLVFSLTTLSGRLCWAVYQQADTFVLGKVAGKDILGFYSMAKELATLPVSRISAVVNQLVFPMMAELQKDQKALRMAFIRGIRLVSWVTFPVCVGIMVSAEDLVRVVLTEKWLSVTPMLQVMSLYGLVKSVDVFLPPVLLARYRAKFLSVYTAALLVVMSLAFWVGVNWWGVMGVTLAWVTVYPCVMLIMAREALGEIGLPWKEFIAQLRPPLVASIFIAASILLARRGALAAEIGATTLLFVMCFVGMCVYGVALMLIGGPVRAEIQEVAGWLLRVKRPAITTQAVILREETIEGKG